ncbi:hypothetical protein CRM22_009273 [Opisthorchis felineus]|uniref:mitogen-activated protein kinase n=1 Tax=Opisthorchis felineus TaxID=147828 RepID=A0A4S2L8C7_OPIFE|nr:hypothetical protein CRM22_009273 [Opisthorchis felineus]TGZ59111.1 hypothetical protein CRM22_009273 [Opisthorchis felineus]
MGTLMPLPRSQNNKPGKPGFVTVDFNHTQWTVPERYRDLSLIGHGVYGAVCSAYDSQLHRRVAIKKLTKPFDDSEYAKRTYRELRILAHVSHENILCLIDAFSPQSSLDTFKDLYLVTPFMAADLSAVVRTQDLSDSHIRFLIYQLLRALKYLHSCGLIHRDLKPGNIGVNEDCELKLLDFGLARQRDDEMTGYVATRWYRAPEIMLNWTHYNEQVDIWSVACIMSELRTRKPLFPGRNHIDQLRRIICLLGKPDELYMEKVTGAGARSFIDNLEVTDPSDLNVYFSDFPEDGVDLLRHLLQLDPDRRYTASQALAHRYFELYHDEQDEPTGDRFVDALEEAKDVSVQEWKEHIWKTLENFVPKLNSLRLGCPDSR